MLKKDVSFIWNAKGKKAFEHIKSTITRAPILRNLDFNKGIILYTYHSYTSIAAIPTQKYEKNEECPIAFFSQNMNSCENKYTFIEK